MAIFALHQLAPICSCFTTYAPETFFQVVLLKVEDVHTWLFLGICLKMGKSFPITEPLAFESLVMAAAKPLLCAALFTKQGAHY